jgi:hypothetical protein
VSPTAYRHSSTPSPRADYADAIERLQRATRQLAATQPDACDTVRQWVNEARQCLMILACCADPAVLAPRDTERPSAEAP